MTIDQNKDYQAVFYLEKGGTFKVDLFEKITPITVNNFVFLASNKKLLAGVHKIFSSEAQ